MKKEGGGFTESEARDSLQLLYDLLQGLPEKLQEATAGARP